MNLIMISEIANSRWSLDTSLEDAKQCWEFRKQIGLKGNNVEMASNLLSKESCSDGQNSEGKEITRDGSL